MQERQWLDCIQEDDYEAFEKDKPPVYQQLDTIIQSSALVEAINAILRPYFNTCANQINQNFS